MFWYVYVLSSDFLPIYYNIIALKTKYKSTVNLYGKSLRQLLHFNINITRHKIICSIDSLYIVLKELVMILGIPLYIIEEIIK